MFVDWIYQLPMQFSLALEQPQHWPPVTCNAWPQFLFLIGCSESLFFLISPSVEWWNMSKGALPKSSWVNTVFTCIKNPPSFFFLLMMHNFSSFLVAKFLFLSVAYPFSLNPPKITPSFFWPCQWEQAAEVYQNSLLHHHQVHQPLQVHCPWKQKYWTIFRNHSPQHPPSQKDEWRVSLLAY